jgi:glucoamylase
MPSGLNSLQKYNVATLDLKLPSANIPTGETMVFLEENLGHDISVLSLAVSFGILLVDGLRIVSAAKLLREKLWNTHVGDICRYEGQSYNGGNPWPLATLWLAIYDGACVNADEAQKLIDWVIDHSRAAGLVPEQVHRESGLPIAEVPLSWSDAMIAIVPATAKGQHGDISG